MSFQDAIKLGFTRATDFKGRAGKTEFWYWFAFQMGIIVVAGVVGLAMGMPLLAALAALALALPGIAVGTRRLHDQGKTGWLMLMAPVPLLGLYLLVLFAQSGHRGPNKYGPPSDAGASGVLTTA